MEKKQIFVFILFLFFFILLNFQTPYKVFAQTCPVLPTTTGIVTSTISLSTTGTYKIWSDMLALDTFNNSYWLQIDSQCAIDVGDSASMNTNIWTWIDYQNGNTSDKLTLPLTAGTHTVRLIGRESNVSIAKLLFSTDLVCIPSGTGGNCSAIAYTPTPVSQSTRLSVLLLLQGLGKGGDNANPVSSGNFLLQHPQRIVTLEIYNSQNQLILSKQGTVQFDTSTGAFTGTFDLGTNFITGVYQIKIKIPQYLTTLVSGIQSLTAGAVNQLPKTTLITGDINGDNTVNILDFNILLGCYSDLLPAVNCNSVNKTAADLNDDGNVNQLDYNLYLRELNTKNGQ